MVEETLNWCFTIDHRGGLISKYLYFFPFWDKYSINFNLNGNYEDTDWNLPLATFYFWPNFWYLVWPQKCMYLTNSNTNVILFLFQELWNKLLAVSCILKKISASVLQVRQNTKYDFFHYKLCLHNFSVWPNLHQNSVLLFSFQNRYLGWAHCW